MTAQAQFWLRPDEWISVNDHVPKPGVPVLCWWPVKTGVKIEACELVEHWVSGNAPCWMYSQDGDMPGEPPTHWMPLPAPPVADGEEGDG